MQTGIRDVLEAIYEADFLECSYGFRPKRKAHDALRCLRKAVDQGEVSWILEADLQNYFDSIDRKKLKEMLQTRIADTSLMRLVGKCLHVGILDGDNYEEPDIGTVQGSTLSPILGNIYLHYALDAWFERDVRPRMKGKVHLWRFADDFVIGFQLQEDTARVMKVLEKRMAKYSLTLHPEKTRLIEFRKPSRFQQGGKGKETFDFLGFTVHWTRTRAGHSNKRGNLHELDVIIYATGFEATKFLAPMHITGTEGIDLHEQWKGDPCAYLRITVPGFPNFFCLYGPNTNLVANGSVIFVSECGARYILSCIELLLAGWHKSMSIKKDVYDTFSIKVEAENRKMAWGAPNVHNWYKNERGRVTQNWPFTLLEYWQKTLQVEEKDYLFND